jgi:hypothetical protein
VTWVTYELSNRWKHSRHRLPALFNKNRTIRDRQGSICPRQSLDDCCLRAAGVAGWKGFRVELTGKTESPKKNGRTREEGQLGFLDLET